MKCPITEREDMIDDCHITVEFGYGSDQDLMTYKFTPVHDVVGKAVLKEISKMMKVKHDIEKYGVNCMDKYFTNEWGETDPVFRKGKSKQEEE